MCDIDTPKTGTRARIAIIYNSQKDTEMSYIGIHMQDIPRAYLADSDSMETGSDDALSSYLLSTVDDDQLARASPNLDKIITGLKLEYNEGRIEELSR